MTCVGVISTINRKHDGYSLHRVGVSKGLCIMFLRQIGRTAAFKKGVVRGIQPDHSRIKFNSHLIVARGNGLICLCDTSCDTVSLESLSILK